MPRLPRFFTTLLVSLLAFAAWGQGSVTVAVMCVNDFHGALLQDLRRGQPGAAWVVQTLDSLKSVYPHHVVVAGGDNFGGSFYYKATRGESLLPQFFADAGITLSVPGNHAFDDGQALWADAWESTPTRPADWHMQYVCANIRRDGRIAAPCVPWSVVDIPLPEAPGGSVSVAFTGLLTSNTPNQAGAHNIAGLSFDGRYRAVLDSIALLPGYDAVRRANVSLLLTHIGSRMTADGRPFITDPAADEVTAISQGYHGLLTAHSHAAVCGVLPESGMPVVQGQWHGNYISLLLCDIDLATGRCVRVTPHIVPVNPHAVLGPRAARLQTQIQDQCRTTTFRGRPLGEVLTTTPLPLVHDASVAREQHPLGVLVAEAYAAAYRQAAPLVPSPLIVGLTHFGSLRAGLHAGGVTVMDVGEVLPFANPLFAYRSTGRQLRGLMAYGLDECPLGAVQSNGIDVVRDEDGRITGLVYRPGIGAEPSAPARPIADDEPVILVVDEYMARGGDGYSTAFFPDDARIDLPLPVSTDAFIAYLTGLDLAPATVPPVPAAPVPSATATVATVPPVPAALVPSASATAATVPGVSTPVSPQKSPRYTFNENGVVPRKRDAREAAYWEHVPQDCHIDWRRHRERPFLDFCMDLAHFFNTYDTTYVERNRYNFRVMAMNTDFFQIYRIAGRDTETGARQLLTFAPDGAYKVGLRAGWRWLNFGFTRGVTPDGGHRAREINFAAYNSRIGCDMNWQHAGGPFNFRRIRGIADMPEYSVKGTDVDGISTNTLAANVYYVFNYRHFAYPAAYNACSVQLRSAGSWMLGASYDYQHFSFDPDAAERAIQTVYHGLHPDRPLPTLMDQLRVSEVNYHRLGVNFGYGYNWVLAPGLVLGLSAAPSIGFKKQVGEPISKDMVISNLRNFHVDAIFRSALIYNRQRWFAGASLVSYLYDYRHTGFDLNNSVTYIKAFVGVQFHKRRKFRLATDRTKW